MTAERNIRVHPTQQHPQQRLTVPYWDVCACLYVGSSSHCSASKLQKKKKQHSYRPGCCYYIVITQLLHSIYIFTASTIRSHIPRFTENVLSYSSSLRRWSPPSWRGWKVKTCSPPLALKELLFTPFDKPLESESFSLPPPPWSGLELVYRSDSAMILKYQVSLHNNL